MALTSTGTFPTADPARYSKQLASHLGRHQPAELDGDDTVLVLPMGRCILHAADGSLELIASAEDPEALAKVRHVVGSHLERFARRHGVRVGWS